MINPYPLLIVMGSILSLVVIQRALTRSGEPSSGKKEKRPQKEKQAQKESAPVPETPRGIALFPGLTVIGLDKPGVELLRGLVRKADIEATTAFLASHRPGIVELDDYLKQLRNEFSNALPNNTTRQNIQSTLTIFTAPPPPAGINFKLLDIQEYEACMTFDPRPKKLITRKLISQFGDDAFNQCFKYYCEHENSDTMSILPLNPDREIIEILTRTGIASKGRQIPLATRLTVLKMNQLRQMCKDLNHDTKYVRKIDATTGLAKIPGSAVLLSMQYVVDDLFVLNPIENETFDIQLEWRFLTAYAKLLISKSVN